VKALGIVRCRGSHISLDNRLTDDGEVSLMRPPPLTPQEDSWYSFLLEDESTPRVIVRLEGLDKLKKSTSTGNETATFRLVA
jgi:hypothetical protein